jgi:hypothetical protein
MTIHLSQTAAGRQLILQSLPWTCTGKGVVGQIRAVEHGDNVIGQLDAEHERSSSGPVTEQREAGVVGCLLDRGPVNKQRPVEDVHEDLHGFLRKEGEMVWCWDPCRTFLSMGD